jgi:hypothetical protein
VSIRARERRKERNVRGAMNNYSHMISLAIAFLSGKVVDGTRCEKGMKDTHTLLTALSFGASGKGGDRIPTVGGLGGEDIDSHSIAQYVFRFTLEMCEL